MFEEHYALPIDKTQWNTADKSGSAVFTWSYDTERERLLRLYSQGKRRQWDAQIRIDWSLPAYASSPEVDSAIGLAGSQLWSKLSEDEREQVRLHLLAWQFSQFLHGEQGALICASKIVQTVPEIDAKFYAATQVMDEARHVEVYSTYLDTLAIAYPINASLKSLLNDVLSDTRWDITFLGMQVLIEGLALAAFGLVRNNTSIELVRNLTAYVMQDEARHVAFGRVALRDYYPQLTEHERAEREEFCAEACLVMRDRFLAQDVWERFGFDVQACTEHLNNSESQQLFRGLLFQRIVPTIRDIGLWSPKMRDTFASMGVMGFADTDLDAIEAEDDAIAEGIDGLRKAQVNDTIQAGAD
ncbi:MAG: ferritin-like domain-containing protein [Gammaproteobacteria bacterium]|nr:ferritin-like domain-containing protein [Gammaproteobacteria bacterium]